MSAFILFLSLFMSSCGTDVVLVQPGPVVEEPDTSVSDVQSLVDEENIYRLGLGQAALTPGLSCTLSKITGGQFIQSGGSFTPTLTGITQAATFLLIGPFNQPDSNVNTGLNVLPTALKNSATYQNLILLRCQGQIVITNTDYHKFDLYSDDGSVLYIDGAKTVDNDGGHGIALVSGQRYLRRGVHVFRLDFAQTGGGNQALILHMNNQLLPGILFYH